MAYLNGTQSLTNAALLALYDRLQTSGCLETCQWAQCSDTEDNDDDASTYNQPPWNISGIDDEDPGCYECAECVSPGTFSPLNSTYLPGKNSEVHPCEIDSSIASTGFFGRIFSYLLAQTPSGTS